MPFDVLSYSPSERYDPVGAALAMEELTDGRVGARTNMFIAASLYLEGGSSPVRVRDMSSTGALLETSLIPEPGSNVRLSRGSLAANGRIMWSNGKRCGVRFASAISVPDWMAPPKNTAQAEVDAVVAQVKAGLLVSVLPPRSSLERPGERLTALARLIEELGAALAADPGVTASHGRELQNIDKALQLIEGMRADAVKLQSLTHDV